MKENDGWTREMYPPKQEGRYLIKDSHYEYWIAYFDGKKWSSDFDNIIAWRDIPTTDINTPF
jgi:hypothetical protein